MAKTRPINTTAHCEYYVTLDDSGNTRFINRLLVATPTRGIIRMEWCQGRYGQIIPCNWSQVEILQYIGGYIPMRYSVDDAQNLIVKAALEGDFQWLLFIEDDTIPPPDAFVRINEYIRSEEVPVVSGLYFTKSNPSEPLVYRGRGTSYYGDWNLGDRVWVDGVPTGFLLIHHKILQMMWDDAEDYLVDPGSGNRTRRVFHAPRNTWFSPEDGEYYSLAGTSDLNWCNRLIEGDYLRKAGWGEFVDNLEDPRYPLLIDTNLFCRHIDLDGRQYPAPHEVAKWKMPEKGGAGET